MCTFVNREEPDEMPYIDIYNELSQAYCINPEGRIRISIMMSTHVPVSSSMYKSIHITVPFSYNVCADPDRGGGGRGVRTHLKNHKNIGFSSNAGPDPLKNRKATKPELNVGPSLAHQENAI